MRAFFLVFLSVASTLFAASAPPTAASVSALRALPPGAYPTVQLLGYTSAGDGGGGIVNWVSTSTKAAAACSVYVPTSNPAVGRWERPSSSIRFAAQCGVSTQSDTLSGVKTFTDWAGTGTRMVVADANGTTSTQSIPAGGSLANPTATIGLSAVNGVATSGMRSDGAPALSQAIVPTWSGKHTFQDTVAAEVALRIGTVAASNITLFRTSADKLGIGDSVSAAGHINAAVGFRVNNAATSGQYLRGNGTDVVLSAIQSGDLPGSFNGFANPSASIGLSAVNGSAATAMRSDAAPALSQAITPTWSGLHTFGNGLAQTGVGTYSIDDNSGTAWRLTQGSNPYINVATTNSSEKVSIGNSTTNPSYEFLGPGSLTITSLAGSGTRMVVVDGSGVTSTQTIPAGASLANPTATIGLSAVNGSATSGMRSDGAPALSQAIAPTWTAKHVFTDSLNIARTIANGPRLAAYTTDNPATNDAGAQILLGFGNTASYAGMRAIARQTGTWSSTNKAIALAFHYLNPGDASPTVQEGMRLSEYGNLIVGVNADPSSGNSGSIHADRDIQARRSMYAGLDDSSGGYWLGAYDSVTYGMTRHSDSLVFKAGGTGFLKAKSNGAARFSSNLNIASYMTAGGNLYFTSETGMVLSSTSDGADTARTFIGGGGDASSSRGGYIALHGNEFSGLPGNIITVLGGVSGAAMRWYVGGAIEALKLDEYGIFTHRATRAVRSPITIDTTPTPDTCRVTTRGADFFSVTLTSNCVLRPENPGEGAHFTLRVRQDGTGGKSITWPADFRFPSSTPPTQTTAANAIDYYSFLYDETDAKWDFVGNALNMQAD